MKKNIFYALSCLTITLFALSCSKSDTTVAAGTPEGNWVGNRMGVGGPSHYFSINFKSGGSVVINEFNATTPDVANGNWSLVGDSVKANFTYVAGAAYSGTYSLAAKYSASVNILDGTIGPGSSTTGAGFFSVTKQ
jgi:hypothetical protein